ncbi:hypothetical protein H6F76_10150 [Leptolyngbya sp. FACHB-321]|uniref:hypothetical protein n=1 Tax=Leptolyngbya sp. FACHB-321 TaxID=2692807 RepID=UPI001689F2E0|nr:hypothetical protein [Leptolyngbya sp. FACHB-321]MBD2035382.1 hypothetical protein [Leptolyngbya sp. FACHB-321]
MTSTVNDIVKQANQGSVAAIIQVLNERLADSGVRTRAIFADGVLQVLCEAATPEQLEPSELIGQVRQTLEAIAPRNIRRVNINSRIVREQQLLWLDEISRDPENQLLWSQEITLNKANLLRHLLNEWHQNTAPQKTNLPTRTRGQQREQRQFWRGLVGGASASVLLLLGGWAFYSWHAAKPTAIASPSSSQVAATPTQTTLASPTAELTPKPQDSFLIAVRIAEQASKEGLTAQSPAQWLELAARWQRASDLMANVPSGDGRYVTAQDRVVAYRKNKEMALMKANEQPVETPADTTADPVLQ